MAVGTSSSIIHLGNIIPVGMADLANSTLTPQVRGGVYSFMNDSFGTRIFRYIYVINTGGMARNELSTRIAGLATTADDTPTGVLSTLSWADNGAFVADAHNGALLCIDEATDAAPQAEVGIVTNNTIDNLELDPDYPLSASPANGDTGTVWHAHIGGDAADADEGKDVLGVIMATALNAEYTWAQCYGFHPSVLDVSVGDNTAGDPAVAAAAGVNVFGSDAQELWVGYFPTTFGTTQTHVPVFMDVFQRANISA